MYSDVNDDDDDDDDDDGRNDRVFGSFLMYLRAAMSSTGTPVADDSTASHKTRPTPHLKGPILPE